MTFAPGIESPGLGLFEGYGVEIEMMIVSRDDLAVLPVSDRVLHTLAGRFESEVERGPLAWSNELVLHVLEMKTNGPAASLNGLAAQFAEDVRAANELLAPLGGQLLPTGMHPWMNPLKQTRLWPHDNNAFYATYDRIFGCRGHGWSNLQSVHLNLPFRGDAELGRLHAAIRCVLPLLPGIAASSPIVDGEPTGLADTRLAYYRRNQRLIPSITGHIVPERVYTRQDYERVILDRIAADIRHHDPGGILDPEWVNSRGAIARFIRDSIEIRLIDQQECPAADLALVAATVGAVRALAEETWAPLAQVQDIAEHRLERILLEAIASAGDTLIDDPDILAVFGLGPEPISITGVWQHLATALDLGLDGSPRTIETILDRGWLSKRILRALDGDSRPARLQEVYRELGQCLAENTLFLPP